MTGRVFVRDVLRVASRITGVSVQEIVGEGRRREYTAARAAIAVFAVRHSGRSIAFIGSVLGKDHTTVLHYLRRWSHRTVVLDVVDAIGKAMADGAPAPVLPPPEVVVPQVEIRANPNAVAPFPPGVADQLLAGVPLRKLRERHPEWRGFDDRTSP